ncbi:TOPRS ligase, partial [Pheucticus melanocephalus]|nr:TOPRS ligase [Pheucticus melanocephalus]
MAMETNWSCPICQGTQNDMASALPCHHQFCLGCILRWALRNPSCPLCRTLVRSIRFSEQSEWDYLQCVITPSSESPEASSQAGGTPGELTVAPVMSENGCHYPVVSPPSSPQEALSLPQQASAGPESMADILPEVWAELFQRQQHLLDPVLPWLCQRLQRIFRGKWWLVQAAESSILNDLCVYGLDVETLVLRLQNSLGEGTAQLVHGLFNVIVGQCSKEAQRLLHSHANEEETHRPSASTRPASSSSSSSSISYVGIFASSPTSSNMDEEAGTSALHGSCSSSQSVPIHTEWDQPQEEPGRAVVAGPSAQGCSHNPSTPGQVRACSPRRPWHAQKRRAPSPQDSLQSSERPRQGPA